MQYLRNGLNKGAIYKRNIGGFKVASYKLLAKTTFVITEEYYDSTNGAFIVAPKAFRSMSIGFPKGHSVHEFETFIISSFALDKIAAYVTPAGRKVDMYNPTAQS